MTADRDQLAAELLRLADQNVYRPSGERATLREAAELLSSSWLVAHDQRRDEQIEALGRLHTPIAKPFLVDRNCIDGDCGEDHNGMSCPVGEQLVCAHCFTLGDSQSEWETSVAEAVMWPCPTAQLLVGAELAEKARQGYEPRYCVRMGENCSGVCPDCGQWFRAVQGGEGDA